MANLVKDVSSYERDILKISGELGKNFILKEDKIVAGDILAYDDTDGKLVKYEKGTNTPFSVALSDADATSEDAVVLVAVPGTGTRLNKNKINNIDLTAIRELWLAGIILEEVE